MPLHAATLVLRAGALSVARGWVESAWWALVGSSQRVWQAARAWVANRQHRAGWRETEYHHTLVLAAQGMLQARGVAALARQMVYVVTRVVGASYSAIFLVDESHTGYRLTALRHTVMLPPDLAIRRTEAVVAVLERVRRPVRLSDVRNLEHVHRAWATQYAETSEWMRMVEARVVVPSFMGERLVGFLILGAKRNGAPYTNGDLSIFSALSRQAALAVTHAAFMERFQAEETALIQTERLSTLGQLAYGLVDELHNTLTIIAGEADLYLDRHRRRDAAVDGVFSRIMAECHRAALLTRRVLQFGSLESVHRQPVDLGALVQETLRLAAYQVNLNAIEPRVTWPAQAPQVDGNIPQLQAAFLEVLVGACRAMATGGGHLDVTADVQDGSLEVFITDTGPAVPSEEVGGMFDPPPVAGAPTTKRTLFLTHRIIQAHGGSVAIQPLGVRGTQVRVRLPLRP